MDYEVAAIAKCLKGSALRFSARGDSVAGKKPNLGSEFRILPNSSGVGEIRIGGDTIKVSVSGKFRPLSAIAFDAHDRGMKRQRNSTRNRATSLRPAHVVRLLRNQEANQAKEILMKLKSIDESVEIIAREMAKRAKGKQ
jgi:hypothetical protein